MALDIKNQIWERLDERGIADLRPTQQQLDEMDTTLHQWYRIVRKKANPSFEQCPIIAQMVGCDVQELFPEEVRSPKHH